MSNTNYSVDVLVNNKPIRKFPFNNKLFVEARRGQEYSIRIKNDTWTRILAVCSVDGLSILDGKKADENGNGYVINGYDSLKLDGFRVSNEKIAQFVFDYKDTSYATSKEDGSEKNVGVIGIRLYQEKTKIPDPVVNIHHHHQHDHWNHPWVYPTPTYPVPNYPTYPTITYGTSITGLGMGNYSSNVVRSLGDTNGAGRKGHISSQNLSFDNSMDTPRGFDLGTKWGQAKESKVIEIEFERGILSLTANIYYASRQSLIEMGVPLHSEKQVSFPEPFEHKYATPPKNWRG